MSFPHKENPDFCNLKSKCNNNNRLSNTPFKHLTTDEQISDREIAKKLYLQAFKDWLLQKQAKMQSKEWSLSHAYVFNELLEELQK